MKPILEVQDIGKKYKIKHQSETYLSLRDSVMSLFSNQKSSKEEFWALQNISFKVEAGESIGIIGRNGAGKSTLLKILSKITPPSTGKIISRGRIASLLEVGTGFHHELTGRENIYLNGSILGLKRNEINKQFSAIVEFSGVEKFLDTPLKHYSSGMQLRLAFAVAAHLEPEILIIDEVLAVGDAEFQKKCIGKMDEVSQNGRTILFVSHNMGIVNQLCKKAIVLNQGKIALIESSSKAISYYLEKAKTFSGSYINTNNSSFAKEMFFKKITPVNESLQESEEFSFYEKYGLKIDFHINKYISNAKLGIAMLDKYGNRIFSEYFYLSKLKKHEGDSSILFFLPKELIAPNNYSFLLALLVEGEIFHLVEDVCPIKVVDTGTDKAIYDGYDYGYIIPKCEWRIY